VVVCIRIFPIVPETNRDRLIPLGGDKRDLIAKSLLFAEQGNNFARKKTGKFRRTVGPELDPDVAGIHLRQVLIEGRQDNPSYSAALSRRRSFDNEGKGLVLFLSPFRGSFFHEGLQWFLLVLFLTVLAFAHDS